MSVLSGSVEKRRAPEYSDVRVYCLVEESRNDLLSQNVFYEEPPQSPAHRPDGFPEVENGLAQLAFAVTASLFAIARPAPLNSKHPRSLRTIYEQLAARGDECARGGGRRDSLNIWKLGHESCYSDP